MSLDWRLAGMEFECTQAASDIATRAHSRRPRPRRSHRLSPPTSPPHRHFPRWPAWCCLWRRGCGGVAATSASHCTMSRSRTGTWRIGSRTSASSWWSRTISRRSPRRPACGPLPAWSSTHDVAPQPFITASQSANTALAPQPFITASQSANTALDDYARAGSEH